MAERGVRSLGVAVVDPAGQDRAGLADGEEQGLVETLVARAAVKPSTKPFWVGSPGAMWCQSTPASPGVRGQLGPVVVDDGLRRTALFDECAQFPRDPSARD